MSNEPPIAASAEWRRSLRVRRSERARRVRLKVYPTGQVEIVLPHRFDERRLQVILDEHEPWVLSTLSRLGVRPGQFRVPSAPTSLQLPAIDESWRLSYLAGDEGRYGCREQPEGVLKVSGGTAWQPALKRWLARKGREHLTPWLAQVSEELALPYSGVSVRGQKSRWGSCSAKRHINLNYALLFLSPEYVRYLFVHELCHTVHLNHSPRYWQLVASKEPDYRRFERELKRAAAKVPPWLHAEDVAPV